MFNLLSRRRTSVCYRTIRKCLAWAVIAVMTVPGHSLRGAINDPTDIGGLRLWLDGSDASTFFTDAAGTIGVTTNGQEVARWNDKSGNGFDVSTTNASFLPEYQTNTLNGLSTLYFNSDALSRANDIGISGNADRTVITVWTAAQDIGSNYQHSFHMGDASSNEAYGHSVYRGGSNDRIGNHYWSGGFETTVVGTMDPTIALSTWDGDGGSGTNGLDSWYVDGVFAGASNRSALATGTDQLQIGSRLNPFSEGIRGNIAEVLVFDSVLSAADQNEIGYYLADKWDLNTTYFEPTTPGDPLFWDGDNSNWTDSDWLDDVPGSGIDQGTYPQNISGTVNHANITEGIVTVTSDVEAQSLTMDTGTNGSGGRPGNGTLNLDSDLLKIHTNAVIDNNSLVDIANGATLEVVDTLQIAPTATFNVDGVAETNVLAGSGTAVLNGFGKLKADSGSLGAINLNSNTTDIESTGSFSVAALNTNNNIVNKSGSGTVEITGSTVLTADADYNVTAGTLLYSGDISGGFGINKTGDGTLALATANTYTGTTTINDGQVHITATGALGTTAGGTDINSGGALVVGGSGNIDVDDDITLDSTGDGGAFNGGIYNQGNDNNIDGQVTVDGDSRIRVDSNRLRIRGGLALNNNLEINTDGGTAAEINTTAITGGGRLTKEGDGTLEMRVASPSYTGTVDINNGVLDVNNSQGLGTGTVEVDGDATLRLRDSINIANAITLSGSVGGGRGEGNQGRFRNDAGSNQLSGNIAWNNDSLVNVDDGSDLTLSGVISGSGHINKSGTGRVSITNGANSFSGDVTIGGGTAAFTGNGSLGASDNFNSANGSTLEINNTGASTANVSVAGDGDGGVGAIHSTGGDNSFSGTLKMSDASVTISNSSPGSNLTFTGPVDLGIATDLTVNGDGNVTISQSFGNGNVPVAVNALLAERHNTGTNQLDFSAQGGGNYTVNSDGTFDQSAGLLGDSPDFGPVLISAAINLDREGNGAQGGTGPFNQESMFGSGAAGDQSNFQVIWQGEFTPDTNGDWAFRSRDKDGSGTNVDDDASIFVDFNNNGQFEASEGFSDGNGQTITGTGLVAGTSYKVAFGFREGSGDEEVSFTIDGPSGSAFDAETMIHPAVQSGLFSIVQTPDSSVVKNGAGNLRLDGDNTYNGTTTVNAGTLTINGTTSDQGSYTVVSGATLAGNGNIGLRAGESIDISGSPGIISPGDAGASYSGPGNANYSMGQDAATVGTLTITGADATSTLNMGGILQIDIFDATTFDQLVVGPGTVNLDDTTSILEINGSQTFTDLDFSSLDGGIFDFLVADDPINGEFSNVLLDDLQEDASGTAFAFQLNEDGNTLSLLVGSAAVVPEPATLLLWSLIGVGLLGCGVARRRKK